MKDGIIKRGLSRARAFLRRLSHPANAAAIAGVAGSLAVTPMLGLGLMQFSASLMVMPGSVHASVAGPQALLGHAPRDYRATAELARDTLGDRLDRAFRVAVEEDGSLALQPAPRFADLDTSRFSAGDAAAPSPAGLEDYAWLSAEADAAADGLALRFASAHPSDAVDPLAAMAALADAATEDVIDIPLPAQRPRIAMAAVAEPDPAPVALASIAPTPERRPKHAAGAAKSAALAYAKPDEPTEEETSNGIFGRLFGNRNQSLLPGRGSKVAVYDIGSATVYMPNGEKLEAHSGLAHMKDNPRYVAEKNKGPTPPNLYNLRMREARFHGVEAIRLLPADGKKKFNRDGLLAHTYMYVGGGGLDKSQSNGCVVFKDYDKFLTAFKRGEIKHMIVVPHLKEVPTYMAAL